MDCLGWLLPLAGWNCGLFGLLVGIQAEFSLWFGTLPANKLSGTACICNTVDGFPQRVVMLVKCVGVSIGALTSVFVW